MKLLYISFLLIISTSLIGQNLVPNPSFEEVDCVTSGFNLVEIDANSSWSTGSLGSPDSFNQCHTAGFDGNSVPDNLKGSQEALSFEGEGTGYAGIITHESVGIEFREYLQAELTEPLVAGVTYYMGFYCSLADDAQWATDGIGMLVSDGPPTPNGQNLINASPQLVTGLITDSENWTLISGSFVAEGGESHVTIGSFKADADAEIVANGGLSLQAYYYIDNIYVSSEDFSSISEYEAKASIMKIFPNPSSDYITVIAKNFDLSSLMVLDSVGKDVTYLVNVTPSGSGKIQVDITGLTQGMYFLRSNGHLRQIIKD